MTWTVSVRLDDVDAKKLRERAEKLGMAPGSLARVWVRSALNSGFEPELSHEQRRALLEEAFARIDESWKGYTGPPIDSAALVREGRDERDARNAEWIRSSTQA